MTTQKNNLALWPLVLVLLASLQLAACNNDGDNDVANNPQDTGTPQPPEPEAPYEPPPAGVLKNASFMADSRGLPVDWSFQQHANTSSYTLMAADGVATITRIGSEPWGILRQSFRRQDVEPLLGKTLEFSAEIAGEFTDEYGEPMEPPGLKARVRGVRAGSPAMLGASTLATASENIDTTAGYLPWRRYSLQFTLPTADKARGVEFDVGVLMTTGGVMRVRGPSLVVVDSAAE